MIPTWAKPSLLHGASLDTHRLLGMVSDSEIVWQQKPPAPRWRRVHDDSNLAIVATLARELQGVWKMLRNDDYHHQHHPIYPCTVGIHYLAAFSATLQRELIQGARWGLYLLRNCSRRKTRRARIFVANHGFQNYQSHSTNIPHMNGFFHHTQWSWSTGTKSLRFRESSYFWIVMVVWHCQSLVTTIVNTTGSNCNVLHGCNTGPVLITVVYMTKWGKNKTETTTNTSNNNQYQTKTQATKNGHTFLPRLSKATWHVCKQQKWMVPRATILSCWQKGWLNISRRTLI